MNHFCCLFVFQTLSQMNLLDKLEKLGLDDVNQPYTAVSPTALMAALENLTYANYGYSDDSDTLVWSSIKGDVSCSSTTESDASMQRNFSNSSVEAMASPRMSPMHHRSSPVGLNMICDLGSPTSILPNLEIRAKFQVV